MRRIEESLRISQLKQCMCVFLLLASSKCFFLAGSNFPTCSINPSKFSIYEMLRPITSCYPQNGRFLSNKNWATATNLQNQIPISSKFLYVFFTFFSMVVSLKIFAGTLNAAQ